MQAPKREARLKMGNVILDKIDVEADIIFEPSFAVIFTEEAAQVWETLRREDQCPRQGRS